ncbi:magnesium/cobalt efflux protein, partial [bacterium]|nr:magnesium/cobalt efflux protein [bacterium]
TIGGFITDLLGHLPKRGEQITYQNLQFTILEAGSRKVDKIKIMKSPAINQAGEG